ncbi:MAG: hypothetical protein AAF485_22595, partial [Chloroflexota bacterium]
PSPPPHPSHLYWMPLTSILAAGGILLGGASYSAAQLVFIILSALLAPLSYWITYHFVPARWAGWSAGLFAIFSGFYFAFWTAIDNFTPFALAGALALVFSWLALKQPGKLTFLYTLLTGGAVGLAHLSRADGPFLLIAVALLLAIRLLLNIGQAKPLFVEMVRFGAVAFLGYLIVMGPWFLRNWQVIDRPLSLAGSQTIWLETYDDLFSYGKSLTPQTFFQQDFDTIFEGRWWALRLNFQTVLGAWGMIFLLPLALIGGWQLRTHLLAQIVGMYGLVLFITMTLVFAFPGARGGLFHSGGAVLPFIYAFAMVGLDRGIDWIAARRRTWDAALAKRVFAVGLVVMAIGLSSFVYYGRVLRNGVWNGADRHYSAIASWVDDQGDSTTTVMIGNPPAYRYHGGRLSVIIPNEDVETTLQVVDQYGVDYLILDRNHPAPLTDLYQQVETHPRLGLVKTFAPDSGNEIYVFEIQPDQQ